MSKLLFAVVLCCLAVVWADALAENDEVIVTGQDSSDNSVVKREALPTARRKRNRKGGKRKGGKRKGGKGKGGKGKGGKRNAEKRKAGKRKGNQKKKSKEKRKVKQKNLTIKNSKKSKKGGKRRKDPKRMKKKKKGLKSKKSKKGKGVNQRKVSNKLGRDSTNYTSCVEKFIEYSRINELKARSIEMQVNRINSFKGIQDKKKGKKGNFQGTYDTLLSALGGNESSPECDGKPINGTTRSAKYKDTLATLKQCETSINTICNYELNTTYNSTLQGCLAAAKQFKKEFRVCFDAKKSSAEACSCVDTIDTANYKKLKECNTKAASDDIKAKKKACIKGFIACKTAQDDSVDGVGSCKKVNKCGGAPNKTEAARLLKILNPLSKALANTKFGDALKKLKLNSGAGSDGKLPSRLSQLRLARAERQGNSTDGQGCKDIEAEWKNFNTSGDKAVSAVDGEVDAAETTNTISSLDKLNNRATLETDLDSCAKEDSRQISVTFTIVKIRFYVFWCGWFQVTIVEIKITILTISFGLPPSPAHTPAPAPVATSSPGGDTTTTTQRGPVSTQVTTKVVPPSRTFGPFPASTPPAASTPAATSTPAAPASTTASTTSAAAGETTTATGCKCGVKRGSRIVGGSETEINEYPWMASVADSFESQFCGGTLIASQWILTATHCMFKDRDQTIPQTAADLLVVLGEHDLQDDNESKLPKKVVKVSQIIKHEDYDKQTSNNDIALLKLSEEVDLNTYTPACLPNTADNYDGKNAWVYGWGTVEYGGASSSKLLEVEVPVVSNTVCQAAMPQYQITDAMLCAGGQLNKDGCQGDSGGPLTVDVDGKHVLIGDVSFGNQCGLEGQYGVYGDVAFFRTWVDTNVKNNGGAKYCPA